VDYLYNKLSVSFSFFVVELSSFLSYGSQEFKRVLW
jgi:hypothetical protein